MENDQFLSSNNDTELIMWISLGSKVIHCHMKAGIGRFDHMKAGIGRFETSSFFTCCCFPSVVIILFSSLLIT